MTVAMVARPFLSSSQLQPCAITPPPTPSSSSHEASSRVPSWSQSLCNVSTAIPMGPASSCKTPSDKWRASSWPWRNEQHSSSEAAESRNHVEDRDSSKEQARDADSSAGPEVAGKKSVKRLSLEIDVRCLMSRPEPSADGGTPSRASALMANEEWMPPGLALVDRPRAHHNAASLAFLGDAVFELYARRHFLTPPKNLTAYAKQVAAVACCEAQDAMLQTLLAEDFLTTEERDVVRWGKNAPGSNTRAKSRAGALVYSGASSLETLLGYIYLTDPKRLHDVMAKLGFACNESAP